jgi:hypothetical protein
MEEVRKERLKYLATFLNTCSAGFFVAGFITPLANERMNTVGGLLLGLMFVSFAAAGHYLTRTVLGGLEQ